MTESTLNIAPAHGHWVASAFGQNISCKHLVVSRVPCMPLNHATLGGIFSTLELWGQDPHLSRHMHPQDFYRTEGLLENYAV